MDLLDVLVDPFVLKILCPLLVGLVNLLLRFPADPIMSNFDIVGDLLMGLVLGPEMVAVLEVVVEQVGQEGLVFLRLPQSLDPLDF